MAAVSTGSDACDQTVVVAGNKHSAAATSVARRIGGKIIFEPDVRGHEAALAGREP